MSHSILSWNGVTVGMLVVICIIGLMMNHFIFNAMDNLPPRLQSIVDSIQYKCFYKCKTKTCNGIGNYRDNNYFYGSNVNGRQCLLNAWEISHVFFHAFLGYFYNIQTSLSISIGFEMYEHIKYDCASLLDLGWNFTGFLIGSYLKYGNLSLR
jgi:hypothetical protein